RRARPAVARRAPRGRQVTRLSRLLVPTLREDPADAEVVSHKLLVRAGMMRQVARGIYDLLPLGLRAVRRFENIVRDEMDRAGAQEILMPAVIPAELWRESGRWEQYGRELLRLKDRYDRDFCFGPTHEEVVTDLIRREVRSYRDLPKNLYQIQVKFRDEVRPRFGLMRGREFLMKDAYSFHVDIEDARREYRNMFDTYGRIFERCGLTFRPVEEGSAFLGLPPERFVKTLVYRTARDATVAVLVRGDHEASETKVQAALGGEPVALADEDAVTRATGAPVGFAGPVGLGVRILADASLRGMRGAVSGANRADEHVVNLDLERDVPDLAFADLRQARSSDRCPRCERGTFAEHRGIEVGQVFLLGTKYSETMGATFLDAGGTQRPIEMGCYGIGITRTVAAAIEQHHDDAGIIWPAPLAPYGALVVPLAAADAQLGETAERLAAELEAAGVDTLLDDRDERPGVKFKDADLIGLPVRLTVGPRALARGAVELKRRSDKQATEVPV